jgi:hypothetical protein
MSDNEPSSSVDRENGPKVFGRRRLGGLWLNPRSPIMLYRGSGVASATEQLTSRTATAKSLRKQLIYPPTETTG